MTDRPDSFALSGRFFMMWSVGKVRRVGRRIQHELGRFANFLAQNSAARLLPVALARFFEKAERGKGIGARAGMSQNFFQKKRACGLRERVVFLQKASNNGGAKSQSV